jgi:hypothetical protein
MFQTTNQISYVKVLIHASPDLTKILRVSKNVVLCGKQDNDAKRICPNMISWQVIYYNFGPLQQKNT